MEGENMQGWGWLEYRRVKRRWKRGWEAGGDEAETIKKAKTKKEWKRILKETRRGEKSKNEDDNYLKGWNGKDRQGMKLGNMKQVMKKGLERGEISQDEDDEGMEGWNGDESAEGRRADEAERIKKAENTRENYTYSGREEGRKRKGGSFMPIKHYFSSV